MARILLDKANPVTWGTAILVVCVGIAIVLLAISFAKRGGVLQVKGSADGAELALTLPNGPPDAPANP